MFCSVLFSHQLKLKFHLSERLISQILDYKHRYHGKIKDCHWLQINNTIKVIKYSASIQAYTYRSGQTFDPSISSSTCILLKSLNNVDDAGKVSWNIVIIRLMQKKEDESCNNIKRTAPTKLNERVSWQISKLDAPTNSNLFGFSRLHKVSVLGSLQCTSMLCSWQDSTSLVGGICRESKRS